MKKITLYSVITLSLGLLFAFVNISTPDIGVIGDVKYSLLNLEDFQQLNGKGWVLLKGQIINGKNPSIPTPSKLFNLSHIDTLPDARGKFIRGMDVRFNGTIDPDGYRNHFTNQKEQIGPLILQGNVYDNNGNTALQHANSGTSSGFGSPDEHLVPLAANTTNVHSLNVRVNCANCGSETRPINIPLYVYVKIN